MIDHLTPEEVAHYQTCAKASIGTLRESIAFQTEPNTDWREDGITIAKWLDRIAASWLEMRDVLEQCADQKLCGSCERKVKYEGHADGCRLVAILGDQ